MNNIHGRSKLGPRTRRTDDSHELNIFLGFYGSHKKNTAPVSSDIVAELKYSGCHWAMCFPAPVNQIQNGATVFIGRWTSSPVDIKIFGRATGMSHDPERDRATNEEIKERPWKKDFSCYIRVYNVEFVNGTLENGVSLFEMEGELKHNSYWLSQYNYWKNHYGKQKTNPKYMRNNAGSVRLAPEGSSWLEQRLQDAFAKHGSLKEADLRKIKELDWPDLEK